MIRFNGYKPDPADVVVRRPKLHLFAVRAGMSTSNISMNTANRTHLATSNGGPGILDQDGAGACTGHGSAGAATLRFAIAGTPIKLLSPIQPYFCGRAITRVPNPDGTLPALEDVGAEPSQVVRGMTDPSVALGWASAETYGQFPASASTINVEPDPEILMKAAEFQLTGAYFCEADPQRGLLQMLMALSAGFPVSNGMPASGNAFGNYTGGVLRDVDLTGPLDHYTYTVDYAWTDNDSLWAPFLSALSSGSATSQQLSKLVVYHVNSWGEGWGESDVTSISGGLYRTDGTAELLMSDRAVWNVQAAGVLQ